MSKRVKKAPIPLSMVKKGTIPKIEKVRVEDYSKVSSIGKEGQDFMKLGEANNVDFNAFFVMFSVWMSVPGREKEAVILQLIKEGKVDVGDDVRKSSEDQ